ncbi:hypothetical protein U9M48_033445 [Paspalum notatum var. saurae]|uniref:BHLH domain-containing protein n=1 Tax=Paspalum notatum var. saurae TaxID=547442 RepID=A0AAQ3X5J3_PASNO
MCNLKISDCCNCTLDRIRFLLQTIVCIPLMSGVLELGTTEEVPQDPGLVSRATLAFWELPYPTCSQGPSSNPSPNEAAADIIVFEHLDHSAMERMLDAEGKEQEGGEDESLSDASLERITKEIEEFYVLFEEMDDVQPLEDGLAMDGSFEVPSSPPQPAAGVAANDGAASSAPVDGSRATCFTAWTRSESDSDEVVVLVIEEPQKLLKKVVAGGAWANNGGGGGTTTRATPESGIKNHVMSERKRRKKLKEMFLILKSMVPSIHKKVDKASILAETIAYVKELQGRVQELESSRELISSTSETTRLTRRPDSEVVRKKVSAGSKRKGSELGHEMEREHPWALSKDGTSNVTVTVSDKEVLLEVQCRWEELMMTRVFDAIKSLHLDVLSVQAFAPDGFMGLKVRAQFAGSADVVPSMISEALRKAIGKRKDF